MRVENTRVPEGLRLRHLAGFHASRAHLVAQLVPLAQAALGRGEPVAVALQPATEEALRAALGGGTGLVQLTAPESPEVACAQTHATRLARELRELTAAAGPVTVIGEHWSRFDGADGTYWTELDAALNVALADLPVTLACFFPELPLHLSVVEGARRNHPILLVGDEQRSNPEHLCPKAVLGRIPAPPPVLLGPPDLERTFDAWQLSEMRAMTERAMLEAGYPRDRAEDVVLAVNEIATNAVEHGSREGLLSVWAAADGFVFEVHDRGHLADPLPGLIAPPPGERRGRGVWIARQICDGLRVWADATGTHVRLHAAP